MVNIKRNNLFASFLCFVLPALVFSGCGGSFKKTAGLSDLEDSSPMVRIRAIKWAGENKVKDAAPRLAELLLDEDPSVRFYAIEGLIRIVGIDNGYDYKASDDQREKSVDRWREYLNSKEWLNNEL
jgi:hypothetical protein